MCNFWIAFGYALIFLLLVIGAPALWLATLCGRVCEAVMDWIDREST